MQKLHYLFHIAAYYLAWIVCIILAAKNYAWVSTIIVLLLVGLQIAWQAFIAKDTKNLYLLIFILTLIGTCVDTFFMKMHIITFNANPFTHFISPPWMIAIWMSFAVIFFSTLKKLFNRYFILGLLSLPGFSLAYYMGVKLHAAQLINGSISCLMIGVTWAFLLPLSMCLYNFLVKKHV